MGCNAPRHESPSYIVIYIYIYTYSQLLLRFDSNNGQSGGFLKLFEYKRWLRSENHLFISIMVALRVPFMCHHMYGSKHVAEHVMTEGRKQSSAVLIYLTQYYLMIPKTKQLILVPAYSFHGIKCSCWPSITQGCLSPVFLAHLTFDNSRISPPVPHVPIRIPLALDLFLSPIPSPTLSQISSI